MRLIGALDGTLLNGLYEAVGKIVLNLSEIQKADAAAVRVLARLPPDRCRIVDCPEWLTLLIEQDRHPLLRAAA